MAQLVYMLENNSEPAVRLADAMLYHHLSQALGEILESTDGFSTPSENDILWGRDIFQRDPRRRQREIGAYRNSLILKAIGGRIVSRNRVDDAMSEWTCRGFGVILRNMSSPVDRIRYTAAGDTFAQHDFAIGRPDKILVQPNRQLSHHRRFLVTGGSVAAESPVAFCVTGAYFLTGADLDLQCEDFSSAPSPAPTEWRAAQRDAVEDLLAGYPLSSGAVDVGLAFEDGVVTAHVESITAAPPGGCDTYLADPRDYAAAVSRHLDDIEPGYRT